MKHVKSHQEWEVFGSPEDEYGAAHVTLDLRTWTPRNRQERAILSLSVSEAERLVGQLAEALADAKGVAA